jgi:hypothetical protein
LSTAQTVNPPVNIFQKLREWFYSGENLALEATEKPLHQHSWFAVMWLTGVDYFSSIAYQAGIALIAAGALSPIATAVLIFVTLFCAVPVYCEVARRSYAGQGSVALLERLTKGWASKLLVLVLLGFAGTDFVITMTLSAADSAQHAVANPYLHPYIGHLHLVVTLVMLALLGAVFLRGFGEAIYLAMAVAIPYIVLNAIIVARCMDEVFRHPAILSHWRAALHSHGGTWPALMIASLLIFPRLALGLSGFETGVSVMPLIKGDEVTKDGVPVGRIRNTHKLLVTAAVLMSVLLIGSSFVTSLLIPESAYRIGGEASGRALAYLAHAYLGNAFGSLYDLNTILILWFAGASAMAGLLNLIPRYLPRFGMAPNWVSYARPLVIFLVAVDVVVTLVFRGSVERQGGAYATGVLVLILSAAVAAAVELWRESTGRPAGRLRSLYAWCCAVIFAYTLIVNVRERPDGIIIASIFIALLILTSIISRYHRATELRVQRCEFLDQRSRESWDRLAHEKINLVPLSTLDPEHVATLRHEITRFYNVEGRMTFIHVDLLDDRSEFFEELRVRVEETNGDTIVFVSNANVVANTIAFVSLQLRARSVILHLTTQHNPFAQAFRYVLFGTGETGLMVYEILTNYWSRKPESDRPLLFLMAC